MANAQAHTHEVSVKESGYNVVFKVQIDYGDQRRYVTKWLPFLEWRTERMIKKVIRSHDKGSRKYGSYEDKIQNAQNKYNQMLTAPGYYRDEPLSGVWGSDLKKAAQIAEIRRAEIEAHAEDIDRDRQALNARPKITFSKY